MIFPHLCNIHLYYIYKVYVVHKHGYVTRDLIVTKFKYEPTLKSKACLKCLYFTKIISALCCYLEYFSYLYTIN